MIEIRTILCPVDFSECSNAAAGWARELAARFGAELHYLHVLENLEPMRSAPENVLVPKDEIVKAIRENALERLAEIPGGEAAFRDLRHGVPFVEIVRYAKSQPVDLIVMGTHGRTGISHLMIGSVAERVVRKAPCAVLTVRPGTHEFEMP